MVRVPSGSLISNALGLRFSAFSNGRAVLKAYVEWIL